MPTKKTPLITKGQRLALLTKPLGELSIVDLLRLVTTGDEFKHLGDDDEDRLRLSEAEIERLAAEVAKALKRL